MEADFRAAHKGCFRSHVPEALWTMLAACLQQRAGIRGARLSGLAQISPPTESPEVHTCSFLPLETHPPVPRRVSK